MSYQSLCSTHAITLNRGNRSKGSHGGVIQDPSLVQGKTNIPCNIQPLSAKDRHALAQRQLYVSHRVYLTSDIGALRDDQIIVTLAPPTSSTLVGATFLVQGRFDQAGQGRVYSIDVREQPA